MVSLALFLAADSLALDAESPAQGYAHSRLVVFLLGQLHAAPEPVAGCLAVDPVVEIAIFSFLCPHLAAQGFAATPKGAAVEAAIFHLQHYPVLFDAQSYVDCRR